MSEPNTQALDGLELDYTYDGGGQIIVSFSERRLGYRWLSGPFEGVEESGLSYNSRHLRDEIFLVNWHDTDNSNFVYPANPLVAVTRSCPLSRTNFAR